MTKTKKTFETTKSVVYRDLSPPWQGLWEALQQRNARAYLSDFARLCSAEGTDPDAVSQADVFAWFSQECGACRKRDPRGFVNTGVNFWNQAAKDLGLPTLAPLANERDALLARKAGLPETLKAEITSYLVALSPTPDTARVIRDRLLDAALLAQSAGVELAHFADLADPVKLLALFKVLGPKEQRSSRRRRMFEELERLLYKQGHPAIDLLARVKQLQPPQTMELPPRKRRILQSYETAAALDDLLGTCTDAVHSFAAAPSARALCRAQAGLDVIILFATLCERIEVMSARFAGTPLGGATRPSLVMNYRGGLLCVETSIANVTPILDEYFRAVGNLLGRRPVHLNVCTTGEIKSGSAVTIAIGRLTAQCHGPLTPDLMRDLAVVHLKSDPTLDPKSIKDAAGYTAQYAFDLRFAITEQQNAPSRLLAQLDGRGL